MEEQSVAWNKQERNIYQVPTLQNQSVPRWTMNLISNKWSTFGCWYLTNLMQLEKGGGERSTWQILAGGRETQIFILLISLLSANWNSQPCSHEFIKYTKIYFLFVVYFRNLKKAIFTQGTKSSEDVNFWLWLTSVEISK